MRRVLSALVFSLTANAWAQSPGEPLPDNRQLISMPPLAQSIMRNDMIDHLAALNEMVGFLAEGKLKEAGDTAENRMGRSTMGKNAPIARGQGPGRFMPESMHAIGISMHDAASEFAAVARAGQRSQADATLQKLMSTCVACHVSYRIR